MDQTEKYTIWLKPTGGSVDAEHVMRSLKPMKDVVSVETVEIDVAGITKKEAILAVTLSVTANFATDGLKAIFAHFEDDETANVVLCRRSDGTNVPLNTSPADD